MGSSFGAAVAVYTGGVDDRVAAVISSGGWGNGERKLWTHPRGGVEKIHRQLREEKASGRNRRAAFRRSLQYPHPRTSSGQHAVGVGTAVHRRYSAGDDGIHRRRRNRPYRAAPHFAAAQFCGFGTPTEQSVEMFKLAGQPADLHLTADTDHFMMAESNTRVINIIRDWLAKYFPADAPTDA